MTFIEQFEQEFARRLQRALEGKDDEASIIRWTSERILESYRNGIAAGHLGTTVKRQGESRRRDAFKPRSPGKPE